MDIRVVCSMLMVPYDEYVELLSVNQYAIYNDCWRNVLICVGGFKTKLTNLRTPLPPQKKKRKRKRGMWWRKFPPKTQLMLLCKFNEKI